MKFRYDIYIHIGLHKTASTFLQNKFFAAYAEECGYINIRKDYTLFLDYILYCNDLEFDVAKAKTMFFDKTGELNFSSNKITISDEQFCASPWTNAKDRKRNFDRLNAVFPDARYIIVLRNQEDITESLYLQYVKKGGSASWEQFIKRKVPPLEFSRKSYLNYGDYIEYIVSKIGEQNLLCLYFEDMQSDPFRFLSKISSFIGFEVNEDIKDFIHQRVNKSLPVYALKIVTQLNKIFSSTRQPFNLLPSRYRAYVMKFILFTASGTRKQILDPTELKEFCEEPKRKNDILSKISKRDLSKLGY